MASPAADDFRNFSEGIVTSFLQTVMVVDDQAFFPNDKEEVEKFKPLIAPGAPPMLRSITKPESVANQDTVVGEGEASEVSSSRDRAHELNAKTLIEDFAAKGIVCAVIKPKKGEVAALEKIVYPLAKNSDVVVFDWVLHGEQDGTKVKQLVSKIAEQSSAEDRRVRLLVVYTGQEDLARITDELKLALDTVPSLEVIQKDHYTLQTGPVRIAVFAKGNLVVGVDHPDLASRVIPIYDMPRRLVTEFTDMTMGLVSNVAMASMATLRENTHRLLSKFHSGLDAPFVAHRAMLEQPDDAGNLLVYLIGSELTAILEGQEISKHVGPTHVHEWLMMKDASGHDFATHFPSFPRNNLLESVRNLLQKGVNSSELPPPLNMFAKNPHKKELTAKLTGVGESGSDLEHEFARLTSTKSDYRLHSPALTPGTLLRQVRLQKKKRKTFYWVCIQPICDSVRLDGKTSFPLLQLEASTDKFDLVLRVEATQYVRVRTLLSPFTSVMEEFAPSTDGSQMVRAEEANKKFYFNSTNRRRYQWIGELKFEHTQRLVNRYAAQLSRVGLDESEWLRRWGT